MSERVKIISTAAALSFALGLLVSCSGAKEGAGSGGGGAGSAAGGAGGGTCVPYAVPAGTDLQQPKVSLKSDVMTVFNNNCGAATCHGSSTSGQGALFLGAESAHKADASQVRTGLVGHAGNELPSMPLVTAGDPSKSYLMHKMDGDQCQFDAACAGGCLAVMPSGLGHVLPAATRDVVRRWIAQGAQDD